jgi:hypothetical protein
VIAKERMKGIDKGLLIKELKLQMKADDFSLYKFVQGYL